MFLDRDLTQAAAAALGTHGVTETVHEAMREVVARSKRKKLSDLIREGKLTSMTMEDLRRMRGKA